MNKVTLDNLNALKATKEKITCLTAYDSTFSNLISKEGIEIILVGDSLGNVIQGHKTTIPVTVEQMAYHTSCVSKVEPRSLIISDLPFMSYSTSVRAFKTASVMLQKGAEMVKLEGGKWVAPVISELVERGIPVCAHLGLTPQSVHILGGYKTQGKSSEAADSILADAILVEEAGANLLVLECVPNDLALNISTTLKIPVIGIGAGPNTDGQVLVLYDILGMSAAPPGFTNNFHEGSDSISGAIRAFYTAVKEGKFPNK